MREPNTELSREDYTFLDTLFDFCEREMLRLAADHAQLGTRIERWRWDVPDIAMSWREEVDFISKSLRFLAVKTDVMQFEYVIDKNAWADEPYAGVARRRLWNNESIEVPPEILTAFRTENNAFRLLLRQAYDDLAGWTREDLRGTHVTGEDLR